MLKKIWNFFLSLRLTIVLLILLSAVCIIGTVVPQNAPPQDYQRLYSLSTYKLMKVTGLTDMYHCWWFLAALGLFTLNLGACSLNRLSRLRRVLASPSLTPGEQQWQGMGNIKKFTIKKGSDTMADSIIEAMAQAVGRCVCKPAVTRQDGKTYIVADTGRLSYLGFYLTHIGMITIIGGVLLGALGFQGYMQIDEGETLNTVTLKNSTMQRELDFGIRCDKFEVSYYEAGEILLRIRPAAALGDTHEYRVRAGQRFAIKDTRDEAVVDTLLPDFAMDNGKYFSRSDQPVNPAAHVAIFRKGAELENSWLFMKFPDYKRNPNAAYVVEMANVDLGRRMPKDYKSWLTVIEGGKEVCKKVIEVNDPLIYRGIYFYQSSYNESSSGKGFSTGLQVTRDPGVNVVWLGCIFLIVGICGAFFMSHRRLYLVLEEKDGGLRAVLAGSASKNRQAFAAQFNRLFEQLKSLEKQS